MALNWVMLDDVSGTPVPLPQETFLCTVRNASLTLDFPTTASASYNAVGHAYVTSHRLIFLRQPPPTQPAPSTDLSTLSVPHDHLKSYRYAIPIFSAPYLEAEIFPVAEGGLPQRQPGETAPPQGRLKIWFKEGGGVAFRDALEKAKRSWEEQRAARIDEETLPAYEPPSYQPSNPS